MEFPKDNHILRDIDYILQVGVTPYLNSEPNLELAEHRIRTAYATSWEYLDWYLFDEEPRSHTYLDPAQRIRAIFGRFFADEDPATKNYATFAFMPDGASDTNNPLHAILFATEAEDTYKKQTVIEKFREICENGEFTKPADKLAEILLNYMAAVHLTRTIYPKSENLGPMEFIEGLDIIFFGNQ